MLYFDTAYIAKCYLNEPGAARVRQLAYSSSSLASCELARVEFHATVHRHLREGNLTTNQAREVIEDFLLDEADEVWRWLPVTSSLLDLACEQINLLPPNVFLRTVDAMKESCPRGADDDPPPPAAKWRGREPHCFRRADTDGNPDMGGGGRPERRSNHLTCASNNGFQTIYSNDRHLLAAAQHFKLTGINVI